MRRGSYIVNTARAEIVVRDAIVAALRVRTARRLCGRCLVSAAARGRPPVAHNAKQCDDAARLGHFALGPG